MVGEILFIVGLIAYILCAALHFVNPIYGYFWHGEYKPLIPLYIPFIDETTPSGFAILVLIQTIEVFSACLASASVDFPYIIVVINVWVFSSIFKENVSELNETLQVKYVDMPSVKAKLQNIFKMYYDIWM